MHCLVKVYQINRSQLNYLSHTISWLHTSPSQSGGHLPFWVTNPPLSLLLGGFSHFVPPQSLILCLCLCRYVHHRLQLFAFTFFAFNFCLHSNLIWIPYMPASTPTESPAHNPIIPHAHSCLSLMDATSTGTLAPSSISSPLNYSQVSDTTLGIATLQRNLILLAIATIHFRCSIEHYPHRCPFQHGCHSWFCHRSYLHHFGYCQPWVHIVLRSEWY